ncbi:MAG: hypothetical protein IH969_11100 [Candidatus Krumholzibacteriota bacterium]|nr:hypothetical protein [Candidatus Krumholzibacteriota bacterium]
MKHTGTSAGGTRHARLDMTGEEFRTAGHRLVDQIAEFMESVSSRPVTRGQSPSVVRGLIGEGSLPEAGTEASKLLDEACHVLFEHSLFNGHPRFFGYITSSAAPLGALADMLAASINPNLGAWTLSPVASEIELQTIRWIAELIGYPTDCAGVLVSGGAMANYICFLAARRAKAGWDVQRDGFVAAVSAWTCHAQAGDPGTTDGGGRRQGR